MTDLSWLDDLGGLLGGGAGIASGGFGTPSNSTSSSSGSSTSNIQNILNQLTQQNNNNTSTTTPNLSPQLQQLMDQLTQKYSALSNPIDLRGYQAQQSDAINRNANLQKDSASNIMAARGLSTSPAAATTDTSIDNNRFSNINNLSQSIPLLKNQLQLSNLGAASGFLSSAPRGSTTTGSGSTTGSTTGSTNQTNTINQNQNSQTSTNQGGGAGGFLGALGSILPFLF